VWRTIGDLVTRGQRNVTTFSSSAFGGYQRHQRLLYLPVVV